MSIIAFFWYFFLGAFLSYIILNNGIKIFKRYFLDKPNKRSSHNKVIPRGGGLIYILLSLFSFLLSGNLSQIHQWKKEQSFFKTLIARPDLINNVGLSEKEYNYVIFLKNYLVYKNWG